MNETGTMFVQQAQQGQQIPEGIPQVPTEEEFGFFIQNLMPGPVFINDRRSNLVNAYGVPCGLSILMEGHEPVDLSGEDASLIKRSAALKQALREGFVKAFSNQSDFNTAHDRWMLSKREEERERRKRIITIDGNPVEAEAINLATGDARGNSSIDTSQQINDPSTYAKLQAAAAAQGIDEYQFQKMVESGEIQGNSRFGKRIPVTDYVNQSQMAPSQIDMTRTQATIAQAVQQGAVGSVVHSRMPLGNFNQTGTLAGYEGQYAQSPVAPQYQQVPQQMAPQPVPQQFVQQPPQQFVQQVPRQPQAAQVPQIQQQRVIRGGGASEEAVVEGVDLAMDDMSWDRMQEMQSTDVSNNLGARPISRAV